MSLSESLSPSQEHSGSTSISADEGLGFLPEIAHGGTHEERFGVRHQNLWDI